MKLMIASALALVLAASAPAQEMVINRAADQASMKSPEQNFTGNVRVASLFAERAPLTSSAGSVTFEPGARSAWHTHPAGQYLIVTSGVGRVQQWGGKAEEIRAGDVVWTPRRIRRW